MVLANALTRVLNQHVPWYAGVEVLPLQDGHAVITRWGLWYWGIRWSSSSLLDQDAVASVASEVQSLAAGNSRRSWPLRVNQKKMRRAHRGDPHWWGGCPVPNATVTEHEVRIWFGAADAPVFQLPTIGRAQTEAAATRPSS